MPTLNSDGSINTSTDGAFNMNNEDDYYNFVCGLISASMNIRGRKSTYEPGMPDPLPEEKEIVNPTVVPIRTRYQQAGLMVCMNILEHTFAGHVAEAIHPAASVTIPQTPRSFYYSKYSGDPHPELPDHVHLSYAVVNSADYPITFDSLNLLMCASNTYSHLWYDYRPWIARVYDADIAESQHYSISDEDKQALKRFFIQVPVVSLGGETVWSAPFILVHTERTTLFPGECMEFLNVTLYIEQERTVYLDGITPIQLATNCWGMSYGVQDGKKDIVHYFSFAYDSRDRVTTGISSHCWRGFNFGAPQYEQWSKEYPGHFWTGYPQGESYDTPPDRYGREDNDRTILHITAQVSNQTDHDTTLHVATQAGTQDFTVPAGFEGETTIDVELPLPISDLTDNTAVDLTSDFNVTIDDGEVTNIVVRIEQDPTIPVVPKVAYGNEDKLTFSDGLACFVIAGAPTPDAEDHLVLTDDITMTHARVIDNTSEDHLVLTDDIVMTYTHPFTGDIDDKLTLNDAIALNISEGFTGIASEQLSLEDNAILVKN